MERTFLEPGFAELEPRATKITSVSSEGCSRKRGGTVTDFQFPAPQPGDSDDVVLALETARVLFLSGETKEAAVRLRRAAEAAERDGNDQRAVTLARTGRRQRSA